MDGMEQTPLPSADFPPFTEALLLTDRESSAAVDRNALRSAGIQRLKVETSGARVAGALSRKADETLPPETRLIVCLPELADMSAVQFGSLIRTHPLLPHIPLLAIVAEPGQEEMLRQCGFNSVLARPFTLADLSARMEETAGSSEAAREKLAEKLRRERGIPSHETFDLLLAQCAPPDKETLTGEQAFRHALTLVGEQQWETAMPFLEKASREGNRRGDARLTLASFWRASGDPVRMEANLQDALWFYLGDRDWGRARQVAERLAGAFPDKPAPLLREIERRAWRGRSDAVLELIRILGDMMPDGALEEAVLKGARAAVDPEGTLAAIVDGLEKGGRANLARSLARAGEDAAKSGGRAGWFRRLISPSASGAAGKDKTGAYAIRIKPPASAREERVDLPPPGDGPAIALLDEEDGPPGGGASFFGDAGAVIRGTMRMYRGRK
jgi:CheY-like chemotaxis protein